MTAEERSKYEALFPQYDKDGDGFIRGEEAVALFSLSGLDKAVLREVWALSDVDQDHRLSLAEFSVAMFLIVCVSKRGKVRPVTHLETTVGNLCLSRSPPAPRPPPFWLLRAPPLAPVP